MHTNLKPVLVVGGAGYIGSHMVLTLQRAGYFPVVLDNLSKGYRHAVKNAELIVGDMADTELLNQLFVKYSFVAVMHFASFIEVHESVKLPLTYYKNNVAATVNLLQVMLQHKVKHFIFSSSAAIYGESNAVNITENHVIAPVNPYGRSKWMVEEILNDVAHDGSLHYASLRYFNAAGADPEGLLSECHDPETHLIPLVLQTARGERPHITVYGNDYPTEDGTCVRDYVHVVDICNAHLLAMDALLNGKKKMVCNLGTGKGHSVMQVIEVARRMTGAKIPVEIGLPRAGDPAILVADPALAIQQLGWTIKYSALDNIIAHAWKSMGQTISAEVES